MKAEEFRRMEAPALERELETRRKDLMHLRCQVGLGEDVHPHRLREVRKEIARIQTVIREMEKAAAEAKEAV